MHEVSTTILSTFRLGEEPFRNHGEPFANEKFSHNMILAYENLIV
jgi:hypothetical protein